MSPTRTPTQLETSLKRSINKMKATLGPKMAAIAVLFASTAFVRAEDPLTLPLVQVQMRLIVAIQPAAAHGRILTDRELGAIAPSHPKPYYSVIRFPSAIMRADLGGGIFCNLEYPEPARKGAAVPPGLKDDEDDRARLKIIPAFEKDDYRFTGVMLRFTPVIEGPKLRVKANGGIGYIRGIPMGQLCGRENIPSEKGGRMTDLRELPWDRVTKHLAEASGLLGTRESLCLDLGELEPGKAATLVVTVVAVGREGLWKKDFAYRSAPPRPSLGVPLMAAGELLELEQDEPELFGNMSFTLADDRPGFIGAMTEKTFNKLKANVKGRWTHLPPTRFEAGKDTVGLWPALPDVRLSAKVYTPLPKAGGIPQYIDEFNLRYVGNPGIIQSKSSFHTTFRTLFILPDPGGPKPRLLFITLSLPPDQ
jgi:hypothetical protein